MDDKSVAVATVMAAVDLAHGWGSVEAAVSREQVDLQSAAIFTSSDHHFVTSCVTSLCFRESFKAVISSLV